MKLQLLRAGASEARLHLSTAHFLAPQIALPWPILKQVPISLSFATSFTGRNDSTPSNLTIMPKILGYTPSWLSRPNPGFQVFGGPKSSHAGHSDTGKFGAGGANPDRYVGSNRTIAHRGAEIFVVVGAQIRWADLSLLKEGLEQLEATPSKGPRKTNGHTDEWEDGPDDGSYRV